MSSSQKRPVVPASDARSLLLGGASTDNPAVVHNWRQMFPEIVGRSHKMMRVFETVAKIARSESSVLVLGESGTGKELIASAIHRLSNRSHKPFIPINCSAIPEQLLESELFGHEKGAFTGADRKRIGHFEAANGGTIFLDEIGDMPLSLQAKLLRVLQDKKFTPLGGDTTRDADVRIVAATNKNLEILTKRGSFRLDLFYRLNVLPVNLPALRERSEDIPELLEHSVDVSNRVQGLQDPCYFTPELINKLSAYDWPGNVRQLLNLVERLVVLKGGGAIGVEDLPDEILGAEQGFETPTMEPVQASMPRKSPGATAVHYPASFGELPNDGLDLAQFIESLENDYIRQALARTGNNKNQAAKLLGLNRTTLVERIKKRKIQPLNAPSKEL